MSNTSDTKLIKRLREYSRATKAVTSPTNPGAILMDEAADALSSPVEVGVTIKGVEGELRNMALRIDNDGTPSQIVGAEELRDLADRIKSALLPSIDTEARIGELEGALTKLNRKATDRLYMMNIYRQMLGPVALKVVARWDEKNIHRVHFSWGPDAAAMTGEERAQYILDFEDAPSREVLPGEIDGDAALRPLLSETGEKG